MLFGLVNRKGWTFKAQEACLVRISHFNSIVAFNARLRRQKNSFDGALIASHRKHGQVEIAFHLKADQIISLVGEAVVLI